MSWVTNFLYDVYEDLEVGVGAGVTAGARWVGKKAEACYKGVIGPGEWIYEALQGDWNDERTPGQIAADSVLAMLPIIDQILDIRDICANCKKLREDMSNGEAWLTFCFCLIGLFPSLGSLVKGVLLIIFVYVKKYGAKSVVKAVDAAIATIRIFLENEKVVAIFKTYDLSKQYEIVADTIRKCAGQLNAQGLAALFGKYIENFGSLIQQLSRGALPKNYIAVLQRKYDDMVAIQAHIGKNLDNCLGPAKNILGDIAARLDMHAAAAGGRGTAAATEAGKVLTKGSDSSLPGKSGKTARSNAKNCTVIGDRKLFPEDVARMSKTRKGLFGEIVSDNYMIERKYESVLKPDRKVVHNLDAPPRGQGIDGVYKNPQPPPGFIVTEVKYRTGGKFNPNTGMPKLKDGTVQMDAEWIQNRLKKEVEPIRKIEIDEEGYDSWLLVVDETGKVTNIYRLDVNAKVINEIIP